jgi:hypothetical protein
MHGSDATDAAVAKLMACLKASRRWANDPLDRRIVHLLKHANEQTLLSIAVYSLRRIAELDPEE